jgi:5-methylcytosine-specific restriction endonuclease McrA
VSPLAYLCSCGQLHARRGLCATCRRERERARGTSTQRGLGADHRRVREQVLAEETTCWLCGRPGTADDPLVADHVLARADGGRNERANYRAAHASCNSRRGRGGTGRDGSGGRGTPKPGFSQSVRVPSRGTGSELLVG